MALPYRFTARARGIRARSSVEAEVFDLGQQGLVADLQDAGGFALVAAGTDQDLLDLGGFDLAQRAVADLLEVVAGCLAASR
jgi:hypothetical protein